MLTWRGVPRSRCALLDALSRGCSCSALLRVTKHRVWLEPWLGRVSRVLVTLCCCLFSVNRTLCSFVASSNQHSGDQLLFVVSHNRSCSCSWRKKLLVCWLLCQERHITF